MESNNKNKKNTVWIILTCVFALTTLVLGMALYQETPGESAGGSTGCGGSDNGSATTTGRSR